MRKYLLLLLSFVLSAQLSFATVFVPNTTGGYITANVHVSIDIVYTYSFGGGYTENQSNTIEISVPPGGVTYYDSSGSGSDFVYDVNGNIVGVRYWTWTATWS